MAEGTRRRASDMQHGMQQGLRHTRDQLSDTFEQYPIAAGAACLGLGLLAGLMFPSTRRENELMGETSDDLKEQAMETGKEALERGQEVATAAASAATEEAQRQGLTPERLGEAIRQTASASAEAAKQEMPSGQEIREKAGIESAPASSFQSQQERSAPRSSEPQRSEESRSASFEGPACDI